MKLAGAQSHGERRSRSAARRSQWPFLSGPVAKRSEETKVFKTLQKSSKLFSSKVFSPSFSLFLSLFSLKFSKILFFFSSLRVSGVSRGASSDAGRRRALAHVEAPEFQSPGGELRT